MRGPWKCSQTSVGVRFLPRRPFLAFVDHPTRQIQGGTRHARRLILPTLLIRLAKGCPGSRQTPGQTPDERTLSLVDFPVWVCFRASQSPVC